MARSLSPLLPRLVLLAGLLAASGACARAGAAEPEKYAAQPEHVTRPVPTTPKPVTMPVPTLPSPMTTSATMTTPAPATIPAPVTMPAPEAPVSNLSRLERAAAVAADSLLEAAGALDSLCLAVVAHDASWLVESAIVERAAARGLPVARCERDDRRRLDVAITAIGVVYRRIDDGIERVAALALSASAPMAAQTVATESGPARAMRTLRVAAELADTLAEADTTGLADAAYPYTVGTIATAPSGGFWRTIVEPAVVLAASAIVAILLYTVRSQ